MIIDLSSASDRTEIKVFVFDRTGPTIGPRHYPNKHGQFLQEARQLHSQGCEVVRIIFNEDDYAQYLNWIPREVWKSQSSKPIWISEDKNLLRDQVIIEYVSKLGP